MYNSSVLFAFLCYIAPLCLDSGALRFSVITVFVFFQAYFLSVLSALPQFPACLQTVLPLPPGLSCILSIFVQKKNINGA